MKTKRRTEYGQLLIQGLIQALGVAQGKRKPAEVRRYYLTARDAGAKPPPRYDSPRIRSLRRRLNLSQPVFAALLNVSAATVRAWERGARAPEGPSRRLLEVAEHHPEALMEKLAS
jgi:putative transcriptional regulator